MNLIAKYKHLLIATAVVFAGLGAVGAYASTPILGEQQVDAETMYRFVSERNPEFDREIAEAFYEVGDIYGIRGDIALCQAIIETGWFRFDNGTAVRPEAHNYCGLGVYARGEKGCSFSSAREGVTAMLQHLYAYCCQDPLPEGEMLTDPRFRFVLRGSAPTWEALSGRWAMNPHYGNNILKLYSLLMNHAQRQPKLLVEERQVMVPPEVWSDIPFMPDDDPFDENIQYLFK